MPILYEFYEDGACVFFLSLHLSQWFEEVLLLE